MGCSSSAQADRLSKFVLAPLEEERNRLEQEKKQFEQELLIREQKHYEKINLLRFKVEILVQMLGAETKKEEALTKRIEALKWALLTQGWSENNMSDKMLSLNSTSLSSESRERNLMIAHFDISGALTRMSDILQNSKESALRAFADSDGKIFPVLSRDDFAECLRNISNRTLSETDIQVLNHHLLFLFYLFI